jgi:hypothetical protein
MATITKKVFTCDVCGDASDVQTWAFGFDGKRYEIDLCPKDGNGLNKVVAGYASKARKVTARRGQRSNGRGPKTSRPVQRAAKANGARAKKEAGPKRSQPSSVMTAPEQPAAPNPSQPSSVMAAPKQTATASPSQPPGVMAAPQEAATPSRSRPQKAKTAPKQSATTNSSQPQKAKTAPKRSATAGRSQVQKAKAAPKQSARAGRSQSQKAEAAPKQAATVGRSQSRKAKAAPKQPATTNSSQPQKAKAAPKQSATAGRSQKAEAALKQAATVGRSQSQKAKAALKQAATVGRSQLQKATANPEQAATADRSKPQKAKAAPKQAAGASGIQQEKGIYVYGVLPADIEVADEIQGVGENPGPLAVVYSDGLAALISEVDLPGRLGSPEDLRTHREILDSTAIDLPVVPLRFGTVFTGEGSVADELLVPRHDEFATALEQLEGRAQFLVRGRYVDEAPTDRWEEDTRALQQAMAGLSVDSVVHEPAHEREAVHVAFLIDVDEEREVELVIDDLGREWAGRIELRLLGPMAAYDFVMTDSD